MVGDSDDINSSSDVDFRVGDDVVVERSSVDGGVVGALVKDVSCKFNIPLLSFPTSEVDGKLILILMDPSSISSDGRRSSSSSERERGKLMLSSVHH